MPARSFQHLLTVDLQRQTLAVIRDHLEPHGRLALHLFDPRLDVLSDESKLQPRQSAVHPQTGRRVWFNQVQIFHGSYSWELEHDGHPWLASALRWFEDRDAGRPLDQLNRFAAFGDGTPIRRDMISHIRETLWAHAINLDWQRGDLAVLDNLWIGHGRMPYRGDRRILLAMADPVAAADLQQERDSA